MVSERLPRQHDPLRQQDRAVQTCINDFAVFGAESDRVFQPDRTFVGEPPDAELFGGAADEAVAERGRGERDEDQPAGFRKLEMPPDRDHRLFLGEMLHEPDAEDEVSGLDRGGVQREDVGADSLVYLRAGVFHPEQQRAARIAVHNGVKLAPLRVWVE